MGSTSRHASISSLAILSFSCSSASGIRVAFLESIRDSGVDLVIPRRNGLGVPNTLNIDNYNAAVQKLISDNHYGTATDRTAGRIWWDVNDL